MNFNPLCNDRSLMEAKFADPNCCILRDPNPCAAAKELLKISASLFAGGDLKAEIVDNNITKPTKQIVIKGILSDDKIVREWSIEKI